MSVLAGTDQQSGRNLTENPQCKVGRAGVVNRNDDDPAAGAGEEDAHPCRRVRPPEQDAIAFANSAGVQFTCKTVGCLCDLTICLRNCAVANVLRISRLLPETFKFRQVVGDAGV